MEKYRVWTDEDRDHLLHYMEDGMEIKEIAEILKRTEGSVEYEYNRLNLEEITKGNTATAKKPSAKSKQRTTDIEEAAVEFLDKRKIPKSREHIWNTIINFQKELRKVNTEQKAASIKIDTNKWIGIAFQGDLHLGNMATNYERLLYDKALIQNADNLYLVINGDYCDNYISGSHVGGAFEALFPPATQKDLAKNYIESVKEKVLALV